MTVVALLAESPRSSEPLAALVEAGVCSADAAADCYAAMVADAMAAVAGSGGELLVNYPPAADGDDGTGEDRGSDETAGGDPETELRELADAALSDTDDVRFEVQVGSTPAARVGNTITHLLEREGADTAAILRPTAPLIDRTTVDGAAMKLRRDDVVLGPTPDGRVYYAGFREPLDFEGALAEPEVATLAAAAEDAGLGVGFEAMQPLADRPAGLDTVRALLRAYRSGSDPMPAATVDAFAEHGILDDW